MEQEENIQTCEHCRHFHQHYIRYGEKRFKPTLCGHCAHPRIKDRKPDTPACQRYSKR